MTFTITSIPPIYWPILLSYTTSLQVHKHKYIWSHSFRHKLTSLQIELLSIKWLSFKWRSICIPCLLQCLQLFLLICCRQPHLFSLLFVHDLTNCTLGFVIKLVQWFCVVYFCCIYLWVTLQNCTPDFVLSFL